MKEPVSYLQTDKRWRSHRYAASGENTNIGSSGCGITCTAMILATLVDSNITPIYTAEWSMKHGYKAYKQGTYYSYFVPQLKEYGIKCRQLNNSNIYHGSNNAKKYNDEVVELLKRGHWVICCMGKGDWTSSGHFVLAYGISNGNILIRDPNSTLKRRTVAPVTKFQYQVKYYWYVEINGDDEDLTQEEFNKMAESWFASRGFEQPSPWSTEARDWGYNNKIMTGGRYMTPITREEAIQTIYNYHKNIASSTDKK